MVAGTDRQLPLCREIERSILGDFLSLVVSATYKAKKTKIKSIRGIF